MTLDQEFARLFEMPAAMLPYLDLVATPAERELVLLLAGRHRPLAVHQVAQLLGISRVEAANMLARAEARAVLDRQQTNHQLTYSAGTFYRRLTTLSVQDNAGWAAVPAEVRAGLMAWHLDESVRYHDLIFKLARLAHDPDSVTIHNRDILLLDEALAIVEAAELHVVVTCDCRTLNMACDLPREGTCFRLDERGEWTLASGEGTVISRERCVEILLEADRAGLLHTGQRADHGRKPTVNGNCCACCSYPIRSGIQLGMGKKWPRSHYLAEVDWKRCTDCGVCVERCPFGAFEVAGGESRLHYDPEQCYGCGLCATGCPEGAVAMRPVAC